jgi:hypothetical protein
MENLCQEKSMQFDYFFGDPVTTSDDELRFDGEMKWVEVVWMRVRDGVSAAYTCASDDSRRTDFNEVS